MLPEAWPYFDKAARFCDPQAPQIVASIRRKLGMAPQTNPTLQAVEAFATAGSLDEMISAAGRFPFMVQDDFIAQVAQQVPAEQRPYFEQRFGWLWAIRQAITG